MLSIWLARLMDVLYRYHYGLGLNAIRLFRRIDRFWIRITTAPRRWMRYVWLRRVVRPHHRFVRHMRSLWTGFTDAVGTLERHPRTWMAALRSWWSACREEWFALGRVVGPVVGCIALILTLAAWTNTDFCLNLTYQGTDLGVVDNAAVYDQGAQLARDRVNNVDDSFSVDVVPVFTLQIQGHKTTLSDN